MTEVRILAAPPETVGEARDQLAAVIKLIRSGGYTVWGWDDGSVHVGKEGEGAAWVDSDDPDYKPDVTPRRARVEPVPDDVFEDSFQDDPDLGAR